MKNLIQINFQNIKNVGIRVDFNVPINDSFQITDNTRLIRAKDTIDFVSKSVLEKTGIKLETEIKILE